jgi:hypothetical protein
MKNRLYFHFIEILLALDQLVNAFTGGWSDETLSSRCYRKRDKKFFNFLRIVINSLFFWQEDHCKKAFKSELSKTHWPEEMR